MCRGAALGRGAASYHVGGVAAGASSTGAVPTSAAEAVRTVAGLASAQHSPHPMSTGELQACAKAMPEANSHSSSTSAASRGSFLRMPAMTFSIYSDDRVALPVAVDSGQPRHARADAALTQPGPNDNGLASGEAIERARWVYSLCIPQSQRTGLRWLERRHLPPVLVGAGPVSKMPNAATVGAARYRPADLHITFLSVSVSVSVWGTALDTRGRA
jgi:hypothetical protein